ncbi:hypothetical protein TREES_T100019395 [Tupaia chinensis]|uniref:Uncharacterized protein n=1 Tax=Tupaia chinensis TaxID=246437 RepID=L9KQN9_TUPCH|nr:hypothetical protein TREES_T100019395 [Tupaia chinensis]
MHLSQVPVAGIEANIPVTYGIGSQRRDEGTGCQFIGQSPVHSVLAAAKPTPLCRPGPRSIAVQVSVGCGWDLPLLVGTGPHPR